jgi:hypothetical protein
MTPMTTGRWIVVGAVGLGLICMVLALLSVAAVPLWMVLLVATLVGVGVLVP